MTREEIQALILDCERDNKNGRYSEYGESEDIAELVRLAKLGASVAVPRDDEIEAMAGALYMVEPIEDSGECIDGFRVTPPSAISWAQLQEFDDGIADCFREKARAAILAIAEVK